MGEKLSNSRIVFGLMVTFLISTIALATYIIYDKATEEDGKEATVIEQYPGYFRTPSEQEVVAKQIAPLLSEENATDVRLINGTNYNSSCDYTCFPINKVSSSQALFAPSKRSVSSVLRMLSSQAHGHSVARDHPHRSEALATHRRQKRNDNDDLQRTRVFHGCCISTHSFIKPNQLPNLANEMMTLAQFHDKNQYFLTQDCRHASGCSACLCKQEENIVTAVVKNKDYPSLSDQEFGLEYVKVKGCCKCFNT